MTSILLLFAIFSITGCTKDASKGSNADPTTERPSNVPPSANAGTDKTTEVNQAVVISGSGTDSDGNVVSYVWKKGSTIIASTASFSYTPTLVGTDTLTLTVTDNNGATASDSMKVVVTPAVTHRANLKLVYDSNVKKSVISWTENSYQDSVGYRVEKRIGSTTRSVASNNWTEVSRLNAGGGTYAVQDITSENTEYRVIALEDNVSLSGENNAHELVVKSTANANVYFTQDDVNISIPLNRTVVVNTSLGNGTEASKVIYYIDTLKIGESSTKPNFPLSFNSGRYTNGTHRLDYEIKIEDASYMSFKSIISTQNTNLALSLRLGRTTGVIPVIAYATSKETINGVDFYLDNVLVSHVSDKNYCGSRYGCGSNGDQNDSYMWEWNSTNYTPQEYTLRADTSDMGGESLSRTLTHQLNNPPVINVTSPIADSVVGNTLHISGTVSDDSGDSDVTIKIGNITIYSGTGRSFSTDYDLTGLPEKIYTLEIRATDNDNKSTIERRNILYKADSTLTVWKTLGQDNKLLTINNGYILMRNLNNLVRVTISNDIETLYDMGKTRSHSYEDINSNGESVYYADKYDPINVSHIFLTDNNISEIGTGQHPILDDDNVLWISRYYNKMHLYSFTTHNVQDIDKPSDTDYWLNWSYYMTDKYFCSSAKMTGTKTNYDAFVYNMQSKQLIQLTKSDDIVEMCQGVNTNRLVYGEYNNKPNVLYYSNLDDLQNRFKLSNNFSSAKITNGIVAWVDNDEKALYILDDNETLPKKIDNNSYLQHAKDRIITYTKDSKLYVYKQGVSTEIWPYPDTHYIDDNYVYIVRGAEQLIYRIRMH